jgi:hypothetical protein
MTHIPTPEGESIPTLIADYIAERATPMMQANLLAGLNFILSTMVLAAPTIDQPEETPNEQDPE